MNLNAEAKRAPRFAQWSPLWPLLVRKLDMVQHCKWIAYRADGPGLGGKGCTRMRPKLHLPGFITMLGHAFRVTGIMAWFVIWKAVLSRCHTDLFEGS
jgi:hypothetical protein